MKKLPSAETQAVAPIVNATVLEFLQLFILSSLPGDDRIENEIYLNPEDNIDVDDAANEYEDDATLENKDISASEEENDSTEENADETENQIEVDNFVIFRYEGKYYPGKL